LGFGKIIDLYNGDMFFKKKKGMSDNIKDNLNTNNENSDNMAQNEEMDEALANMLNTDDSNHGTTLPDEGGADEVEKLTSELAEMKDKHLRLIAEFDNYKRRTAREKEEMRLTAGKDMISSLLTVLDDMGRAEAQIAKSTDIAAMKEGLDLVFGKLRNVLQQKGLKVMEAVNTDFDADLHEAITEIPAPKENMVGKVIDVVEPGYYLNDKLIRYAKVVVGK